MRMSNLAQSGQFDVGAGKESFITRGYEIIKNSIVQWDDVKIVNLRVSLRRCAKTSAFLLEGWGLNGYLCFWSVPEHWFMSFFRKDSLAVTSRCHCFQGIKVWVWCVCRKSDKRSLRSRWKLQTWEYTFQGGAKRASLKNKSQSVDFESMFFWKQSPIHYRGQCGWEVRKKTGVFLPEM